MEQSDRVGNRLLAALPPADLVCSLLPRKVPLERDAVRFGREIQLSRLFPRRDDRVHRGDPNGQTLQPPLSQ